MERNYDFSTENIQAQSDIEVFASKTKNFFFSIAIKFKTYIIPNAVKLLYKLSILKDFDEEITYDEKLEHEYSLKTVNACNQAKQVALLDMAVYTSPQLQECIIEQKTLKETVIDFQVVKSRLFIENRSAKGNFLYEGALVEQICNQLDKMTPALRKIYMDLFNEEIYQYHCNSFLDIKYIDLFDQKWMEKILEKFADNNCIEVLSAQYPIEVLNKFRFIYMLIKVQEIKYDAISKTKSQS